MHQKDYVTREEFNLFTRDVNQKFEELKQLIVDIAEHLTKKIDMITDRLDIAISRNALEHHKFEARITKLEPKSS